MPVEHKAFDFAVKAVNGSKRTIAGHLATWKTDSNGDRIIPGAFTQTLEERGPKLGPDGKMKSKIKMCYNHRILIGVPQVMVQDEKGLYFEGLVDEIPVGDQVLKQVESGSLDQMSFAYDVKQADYDPKAGERLLKELMVYEGGPVDMAMNEDASILGVKSAFARQFAGMPPEVLTALHAELKAGKMFSDKNLSAMKETLELVQKALTTLGALIAKGAPSETTEEDPAPDSTEDEDRKPGSKSQQVKEAKEFGEALLARLSGWGERLLA